MSEDVLEVRKSTTDWNAHSSLLEFQTLKLSLARLLALSRSLSLSLSLACACKKEDLWEFGFKEEEIWGRKLPGFDSGEVKKWGSENAVKGSLSRQSKQWRTVDISWSYSAETKTSGISRCTTIDTTQCTRRAGPPPQACWVAATHSGDSDAPSKLISLFTLLSNGMKETVIAERHFVIGGFYLRSVKRDRIVWTAWWMWAYKKLPSPWKVDHDGK
jgi:hypothetical protein